MKLFRSPWLVSVVICALALVVVGVGIIFWSGARIPVPAQTPWFPPPLYSVTPRSTSNAISPYISRKYNYAVSFPSAATLDATEEACVTIQYKAGFVTIGKLAEVVGPCWPTGVGLGNTVIEETVTIAGKTYRGSGFRYSPEEYRKQVIESGQDYEPSPLDNTTSEFVTVNIDGGFSITYGIEAETLLSPAEYADTRNAIRRIVRSLTRT